MHLTILIPKGTPPPGSGDLGEYPFEWWHLLLLFSTFVLGLLYNQYVHKNKFK